MSTSVVAKYFLNSISFDPACAQRERERERERVRAGLTEQAYREWKGRERWSLERRLIREIASTRWSLGFFKAPSFGPLSRPGNRDNPSTHSAPDGQSSLGICTPVTGPDIWHALYPVTLRHAVGELTTVSLNSSHMPTVADGSAHLSTIWDTISCCHRLQVQG